MEITYQGLSSVRLRGREVTVHVDPPQAALPGLAKSGRDLVVRTEGPTDTDALRVREGQPQVISGPGEFEARGVSVFGMPAGAATLMRVEVDEIRVACAGRLNRALTEDEIDALGHVDVLVVPVGGGDSLSAVDATKLVNAVEPAVVVPVRFGTDGYEPVEKFAKEMGLAEGTWQMQPRLTISATSAAPESVSVVILEPRAAS